MSGGKLLSPDELIDHMRRKGISFDLYSAQDAKHFLTEHTYYTKIAAYRRNYPKYDGGQSAGMYQGLDFAYLVELSVIDMRLRYMITYMTLDIEHSIKISLLNDILGNPDEDGYRIVDTFFNSLYDGGAKDRLERKMQQSYCREFYFHNESHMPIWVLLEVLSFGELIRLYKIYFDSYPSRKEPVNRKILDNVRNIRNACAHNNCLIYDLRRPVSRNTTLSNIIAGVPKIAKSARKKYLGRRFPQDFAALLIAHKGFVKSEKMHSSAIAAMRDLFAHRCIRHHEYFRSADIFIGTFKFCLQLINHYYKK